MSYSLFRAMNPFEIRKFGNMKGLLLFFFWSEKAFSQKGEELCNTRLV